MPLDLDARAARRDALRLARAAYATDSALVAHAADKARARARLFADFALRVRPTPAPSLPLTRCQMQAIRAFNLEGRA